MDVDNFTSGVTAETPRKPPDSLWALHPKSNRAECSGHPGQGPEWCLEGRPPKKLPMEQAYTSQPCGGHRPCCQAVRMLSGKGGDFWTVVLMALFSHKEYRVRSAETQNSSSTWNGSQGTGDSALLFSSSLLSPESISTYQAVIPMQQRAREWRASPSLILNTVARRNSREDAASLIFLCSNPLGLRRV